MLSLTKPVPWNGDDGALLKAFLETDSGKKFQEILTAAVPTGRTLVHSSSSVTLGMVMGSTRMLELITALVLPPEKVAEERPGTLPDVDNDELFNSDGTLKNS